MIFIGIDPGTPLTVAAVSGAGGILDIWDGARLGTQEKRGKTKKWYNDPLLLRSVLAPYAPLNCHVVLERVSAMPNQGLSSSVRFVGSMHLAHGVAVGLGMPITLVTPSVWKKALKLTADKERSRAAAIQTWPDSASLFGRKMDHDRAEAALLAQWGVSNLR